MSYLITVEDLKSRMETNLADTVIIDVRFQLANHDAGRKAYEESHIPGAFFLDMDEDLSGEVKKHGGNHPLPDIDQFSTKIGNLGIDNDTTVVVYDQENDMFAARLWWMLHYMGHEKVFVLDGGFQRWQALGNAVTAELPIPKKKVFTPELRSEELVDMNQVKEKIATKSAILIDSRARERYLGKTEPLYKKAGHIPGAKNYFWKDVLDNDGLWKSSKELEEHYANLPKDEEIIVSCGSGVSATPNILALKMAGYKNIKLYSGSYSDWISYEENEVNTEEE